MTNQPVPTRENVAGAEHDPILLTGQELEAVAAAGGVAGGVVMRNQPAGR
ncbi:MAG: hypothetical protein R3D62_00115 [Xanthobacteraceae bacterium]